jgi:serine/threonine protein kinase/tetratricopeptide (TPR) repeat protein
VNLHADPGKLLSDRYDIVRPLASGGMGEVLLARQINLDRLVVIKRAVNGQSGRELRALVDEAHVAARLHHPNIVSVIDVIGVAANPMVVLELVVGVSLRELIDRTPDGLPVDVALTIITDVLRGLAYAHAVSGGENVVGIVHRDVKPRNVMVTFAGVTKLIDFGISRWLEAAPTDRTTSGTRGYMAPEQERGEPVDGRADQYAAGVTLREMLSGSPLRDEPDAPTSRVIKSSALSSIVERATAPRPQDRYADCGEMIAALERHAAAFGIQLSAMQVERWMSRHFADRKQELERDPSIGPRRPRAPLPVPQTVVVRRARKPNRALVAFSARNTGATEDDWLSPIVERMVRWSLRDREDRRFHVVARAEDAELVELAFTRAEGQFHLEARAEDGRLLARGAATSVAGAVGALGTDLATELGAGLPPVEPDPGELEEMSRIGAASVEQLRRYRRLLHAYYATNVPDTRVLAGAARALVAEDPMWAHAHVLLAMLEGVTTEAAAKAILAARGAANADRDPSGTELLAALERFRGGDLEGTFDLVDEVVGRNEHDLLAVSLLLLPTVLLQRTEEAAAMARRLHIMYPDLAFGVDLAETLRRRARDIDADRVIREWAASTPESLLARVELVRIEARAGRLEEARARARESVEIHDGRDDALPNLFEALVASDQLSDARAVADRMLVGSPLARARGRYRVALIAVFEGQFAAAYDAVRRAISDNRRYGIESELLQCLELARAIAPLVADVAVQRRYTEELANVFATLIGDMGSAAATRFELSLLDRGTTPPSIEAHLEELEDGPVRDVARRRMLRAAAVAGCGDPEAAVAAGFSAFEENTASLVALGLCARRVGELELAQRSLERATQRWSSINSNQNSPYHAVLARFHLAGVLADQGDRAAAHAGYEAFLRCWSDPDRPIPEITAARWLVDYTSTAEGGTPPPRAAVGSRAGTGSGS